MVSPVWISAAAARPMRRFFVGKSFELCLEGAIVLKWLVKKRLNGYGASVGALQKSIRSQLIQVPPDSHRGNGQLFAE